MIRVELTLRICDDQIKCTQEVLFEDQEEFSTYLELHPEYKRVDDGLFLTYGFGQGRAYVRTLEVLEVQCNGDE